MLQIAALNYKLRRENGSWIMKWSGFRIEFARTTNWTYIDKRNVGKS